MRILFIAALLCAFSTAFSQAYTCGPYNFSYSADSISYILPGDTLVDTIPLNQHIILCRFTPAANDTLGFVYVKDDHGRSARLNFVGTCYASNQDLYDAIVPYTSDRFYLRTQIAYRPNHYGYQPITSLSQSNAQHGQVIMWADTGWAPGPGLPAGNNGQLLFYRGSQPDTLALGKRGTVLVADTGIPKWGYVPHVIVAANPDSSVSGTTNETCVYRFKVPANTLVAGAFYHFFLSFSKSGVTGSYTPRIRQAADSIFAISGSLGTDSLLATAPGTALSFSERMERTFAQNTDSTWRGMDGNAVELTDIVAAAGPVITAVDISTDNWFFISITLASPLDTVTLNDIYLMQIY